MLLALELFLPFGLEFPLELFDPGCLLFDLVIFGRVLGPQGIDLPVKRVHPIGLLVRGKHEHAQRRPAQVRAVADVRTTVFVFGVETEVHRRPFRQRIRDTTIIPPQRRS